MKRVLVCYGQPDDSAAFDQHYRDTHVPLVSKIPHLVSYEISSGPVVSSDPAVDYYLIAILSYASQEDMDAAMASPEGQTAVEDLGNFATGGVTILTIDAIAAGA